MILFHRKQSKLKSSLVQPLTLIINQIFILSYLILNQHWCIPGTT